jgi:hypothetical protein
MIMAVLTVLATQAVSDSEALRRALPALELTADRQLDKIYEPYFRCYTDKVEGSAAADLKDDAGTAAMWASASEACAELLTSADADAITYLTNEKHLGEAEGRQALSGVRRLMWWHGLSKFFHGKGKLPEFQSYLARVARGEASMKQD